ncbi:hypothetical protein QR680_018338 [Steinernema hermaphroditum]|uniref:Uncharacterized protein n=1 Tax=Steinernema hermaphroditum TaxID=289476 RepID=A0AA39HIW8_9BILA|nr:hypothetical protein QR680_018338 [Steinernema hermaphroditum]
MIWRSAKEINDKFDDEFYLIPLQTIGAKRNACVAGYEYLFEFKVFQSVHIKTERSFDELRDAALEFTGNDQVLRCSRNEFEHRDWKKKDSLFGGGANRKHAQVADAASKRRLRRAATWPTLWTS